MSDVYLLWGFITCGLLLAVYGIAVLISWVDSRNPRNWPHKRRRANERWGELIGSKK